MKLNWGSGIAIFYTTFVIVMVGMVIMSTQNKADLVQDNYYALDIDYEEFRLKRQNFENLGIDIVIQYNPGNKEIRVLFPESYKVTDGKIRLYRPSNKWLDKEYPLKLDTSGSMRIPVDHTIARGLWKVILDWEGDGIAYYTEEQLVI